MLSIAGPENRPDELITNFGGIMSMYSVVHRSTGDILFTGSKEMCEMVELAFKRYNGGGDIEIERVES